MMQPQAVIFDFGMVLSQPQSQQHINEMAALLDSEPAEFSKAYWQNRHSYDLGVLDGPAYWHGISQSLNRTSTRTDDLIGLDIKSWMSLNEDMMSWAHAIRASGLRTAILSNMPYEHRDWMVDHSGWLSAFDSVTFSCDLGIAKPDPAIYEHCLKAIGATAETAIFFDDREENIHAAKQIGIHAVHFTTPAETLHSIHETYRLPAWSGR